jgi:P-aminobenzoate N-oxygenase AurF
MSTMYRYALPVEQTKWKFDGKTETCFTWEYDDVREALLQLYDKGKKQQWDAAERIDWSLDLDPENPMMLDDRVIPIFGTDIWNRMTEAERRRVRHHLQASQISQFMHGEQGALIATAKIVQTVPDIDSKFYAATQVMDEARHVEAYSRLLHEKFELAYPITHGLSALLEQGLSDNRWDMTYLTMQILIEGLALAAFQRIRDQSRNPLAAAVNAYVMQDEARHVAFGRIALRDYYPQLSEAERGEREEFVVEACWHMRDRFNQLEVWQRLGLPIEECLEIVDRSEAMNLFRSRIFSRIVPTVRDIGLWGPRVHVRGDGCDRIRERRCGCTARQRRARRRRVRRPPAVARRLVAVGSTGSVIASPRVGAMRRPRTGSAKQSRWGEDSRIEIASSLRSSQ